MKGSTPMSWADELDEQPEPKRETGLDWLRVTTEAERSKADRRMSKARRRLNRAERKYLSRGDAHAVRGTKKDKDDER